MAKPKKAKDESAFDNSNDFSRDLVKDINKEAGFEITFLLDDGSPAEVKEFISTGSTLLDIAISNRYPGGIPCNRMIEFSGLPGSGKSLLAMQTAANFQRSGGTVVFLDYENSFSDDFAERVGLDASKNFIYAQPPSIEEGFKIVFRVMHNLDEQEKTNPGFSKKILIIWDSIAAAPCAADIEAENPDPTSNVGLKPRVISKNISTVLTNSGRKSITFLFLNQLRTNIRAQPFSDPYVTPGGNAIPFACSVRVRLAKGSKIKLNDEVVGVGTFATCEKTRFGPNYRKAEFPIYFTKGVDDLESLISYAENTNIIGNKAGGTKGKQYWFKDENKEVTMNRKDFKKYIRTSDKLEKLKQLVATEAIKELNVTEDDDVEFESVE